MSQRAVKLGPWDDASFRCRTLTSAKIPLLARGDAPGRNAEEAFCGCTWPVPNQEKKLKPLHKMQRNHELQSCSAFGLHGIQAQIPFLPSQFLISRCLPKTLAVPADQIDTDILGIEAYRVQLVVTSE